MKKLVLAIFLAAPILAANAQSGNRKFGLGVNAGMNLFKISESGAGDIYSSKAGFTGGINAVFPVTTNLYIQPEINYQQEGAKVKYSDSSSSIDGKFKLGYLNVPVLVKYKFPSTQLSVYAGPQLGILLSAKMSGSVTSGELSASGDGDIKSSFNTAEFAGVYGLEYYFPVTTTTSFVINARYQTGFSNIAKDADNSVKNNGFAFTVGYRF